MAIENNDVLAQRRKLRTRRRLLQLLGAVVSLLVVVGIISTISAGVGLVANIFDDTQEKEAFQERLRYLVALDPLPFESMSDAPMNTLLNAALWTTVSGTNSDDYEHDEVGAMYLPTADIDKTIEQLYGPDIKFNYATFTDRDLTFIYVPEKQAYLMPITSAPTEYSAYVEKIKREGNTKRVTVGYDSPYDTVIQPLKYNDYIFTRGADGEYYLTAIVASETRADSQSDSQSTSQNAENAIPATEAMLSEAANEIMAESSSASEDQATSDEEVVAEGENADTADTGEEAATSDETASG